MAISEKQKKALKKGRMKLAEKLVSSKRKRNTPGGKPGRPKKR